MTARAAFLAGYGPPAVGLYYNGVTLLTEAARAADPPLAERIAEALDRVVPRREAALAELARVEESLGVLRVAPPPRPDDAGAYPGWAEAVFEAVNAAAVPGSADAVAHLLGYVLGEGMATLDAIAILAELRDCAPDHVLLRMQGQSLADERTTAERRLGRLAAHPLLPEPVQAATARAAHEMAGGVADRLAELAVVIADAI